MIALALKPACALAWFEQGISRDNLQYPRSGGAAAQAPSWLLTRAFTVRRSHQAASPGEGDSVETAYGRRLRG